MSDNNNPDPKEQQPSPDIAQLIKALSLSGPPQQQPSHKFWSTQPVPKQEQSNTSSSEIPYGPIEPNKPLDQVRQDPYKLPNDFEWCLIDITQQDQLKEVYELLSANYVEDSDAIFRFDYSADFLKWALQPPGWKKEWHLGVRVVSNKKLVAFISGVPIHMRMHKHQQLLIEINFLCVHKKLRSKRLAPVLIKEITRRVHLFGIFQAVYTAGVELPTPFSTCRYYHRSLNPKKLIETGFSALRRNWTMARTIRLYKVPAEPSTPGFRAMTMSDVPLVFKYLNEYMKRFPIGPHFDSEEEVAHWLLPRENVVHSFVVEDLKSKHIKAFVSYYSLPSSVIGHATHSHINAAYLFYYFVRGCSDRDAESKLLKSVMNDALTCAHASGFDVMNCLNLLDNASFLEELKFGKGDGQLHYYLYNYHAKHVEPKELGLVML